MPIVPLPERNKVPSPKVEGEHQLVLDFKDGLDLIRRRVDRLPFRNKLTFLASGYNIWLFPLSVPKRKK